MALAFFDWVKQFTGYSKRHRHSTDTNLLNRELRKFECARISAKRGGVLQPEAEEQARIIAQRELNFIATHSCLPVHLNSAKARQHVPRCSSFLQQIMTDMGFKDQTIEPWPVHCDTVSQDLFITCQESLANALHNDDGTLPMDICCASNQHLDEFVVLLELLTGMKFPKNSDEDEYDDPMCEDNFGFASAIRLLCVHDTLKDTYQTLVYFSRGDDGGGEAELATFDYVCTLKISDVPQMWLKDHIARKQAVDSDAFIYPTCSDSKEEIGDKKKKREATASDREMLASYIPVCVTEPEMPSGRLLPVHSLLFIRHGFRNDKVESNLVFPIGTSEEELEKFKLIGVPKVGEELKIEQYTDERLDAIKTYLQHLDSASIIPGLDRQELASVLNLIEKARSGKLGVAEQFKVKLWRLPKEDMEDDRVLSPSSEKCDKTKKERKQKDRSKSCSSSVEKREIDKKCNKAECTICKQRPPVPKMISTPFMNENSQKNPISPLFGVDKKQKKDNVKPITLKDTEPLSWNNIQQYWPTSNQTNSSPEILLNEKCA
eukprot:Platyproteum_vivax@DN12504_c0_g1_i1.p1